MRKLSVGKNLQFILAGLVLVAIVAAAVLASGNPADKTTGAGKNTTACGDYRTDKVVRINGQAFNTEVASTASDKEKGLSGRSCILPNQAMLFSFKNDEKISIWMKGMNFPIDVIWITSGHKIAAIERDFQPSSYPERRQNQLPAKYVLEVKANRTKELNANIGTLVGL